MREFVYVCRRAKLLFVLKLVSYECHTFFAGNFLNGGTPRGGAYGFKVDVLKKFSELKVRCGGEGCAMTAPILG